MRLSGGNPFLAGVHVSFEIWPKLSTSSYTENPSGFCLINPSVSVPFRMPLLPYGKDATHDRLVL
jgi:hypothetical protein